MTTRQMHLERNGKTSTGQGLIMAVAAVAGLALAGGCSTHMEARYSPTSTAYVEATVTPDSQPEPGRVMRAPDYVNTAPESAGAAESPRGQFSGEFSSFEPEDWITNPSTLVRGHDSANFEGRPVRFSDLRVDQIMDGRLLLVPENGRSMYATCRDEGTTIRVGDTVTITGTLRRGDGSEFGLAAPSPQPPMSQPYYIETDKIEGGTR